MTLDDSEVFDVKTKFLEMEKRMAFQDLCILSFEQKVRNQDQKILEMEAELSRMRPNVRKMEVGLENLRTIISRTQLTKRSSDQEQFDTDKNVEPSAEMMAKDINNDQGKRTFRKRDVNSTRHVIGFYAYMGSDEQNPSTHHTLVFDEVKANAGNGYNKYSGLFIAPVSGLYGYSCSITMHGTNALASYNIVKNAEIVGTFFVDSEHSSDIHSSSMTVIIMLDVGDILFVRTHDTYVPHGNVVSDYRSRSAVAGWLIQ